MNSAPKIIVTSRPLSLSEQKRHWEKNSFATPTCHSTITKKPRDKKIKVCRKRLSFSPNINLFTMASPVFSPIKRETSARKSTTPSVFDFSPRAINRILKLDAEQEKKNSPQNLSYLNKTISIENILKSCGMEKYVEIFRNEEIDNLAVFTSLTERDLVEIGIKKKSDRLIILDICAEYQGDL